MASDFVECEDVYDVLSKNLLGNVIVVDTIENGIKLSKITKASAKIVTLAGEVIATTGSITGGSVAGKQMTLVGRSRKLNEYKKRLESIEKEYAAKEYDYNYLLEKTKENSNYNFNNNSNFIITNFYKIK